MDTFEVIQQKLEAFIHKYHMNALIKGVILFFAIGLFYFLITLLVEHFLWLGRTGRTLLFWLFVAVEFGLFIKLICIPVLKLFKLSKGIDYSGASVIIGNHFPEVSDRLLNVLQLNQNKESSELLLASIAQKSEALQPIPFKLAINFKKNLGYLKYAAIPLLLFLGITLLGKKSWFTDSYTRVVHYRTAYEPPAPFSFFVINESLTALENKSYTLQVKTVGELLPENVSIQFNGETYFLQHTADGNFEYTFDQPKVTVDFLLKANEVQSKPYTLEVVAVPTLLNFEMALNYPGYTRKNNEVLKSSGNATVPEGTRVTWNVTARNTDNVTLISKDSTEVFTKEKEQFRFQKGIYSNLDYELTTSNKNVSNYENLAFNIRVVKDQYPELVLRSERDSIDLELFYFLGQVSDDYGLSRVQLVYYDAANPQQKAKKNIQVNKGTFDEFSYTFPDQLPLKEGVNYEFYFQVFDNDVIHNYKSIKSEIFNYRQLTEKEKKENQLQQQSESIGGFKESLEKLKDQDKVLEELSKTQKEKKALNFNEKKKLQNFLDKQKKQEQMMKNFTKKLKDNLDKFEGEKKEEDPFKKALKERLERQEEKLKKNEKLLEELKILADKLQKEQLTDKLEKLAKQNKNTEKNLKQMVELTKRYYVIKKHEQLAEKLNDLAEKQEALSKKEGEDNTKEKQDELTKEFEEFQKEMNELREANKDLEKPMNLDQEEKDENEISEEQKEAGEKLGDGKQKEAQKNQKNAAQKMKEMGKGMQMEMSAMSGDSEEEDADMLRQILDNLVDFSLEQEGLMDLFKSMTENNPAYAKSIRRQSVLREHFKHIDDSLYALALRTPMISDHITEKLTDIEFNIDKSLELLSENQLGQGASNQQYAVTNSNDLAYMLSRALDQMNAQMSASASGKGKKGKGKGFQLPDIIKKQEELNEEMRKGLEKGNKGKDGKEGKNGEKPGGDAGQKGGEGKGGKEGEPGKDGESGKEGNESKNGEDGKSGKDGKGQSGKDGRDGKDGNQQGDEPGDNELLNGELYEIYKEQQQLRQSLQDRLSKEGLSGNGDRLLRQMEQVEQELLDKGFNQQTMEKMLNLKHELLKMDKATFQQGEEQKRESETNTKQYDNTSKRVIPDAKQYFNTTEILNRQVLPLRQIYKKKVQDYFKKEHD